MDKSQLRRGFYPYLQPFQTGMLQVSEIHSLYWEVSGNPEGQPVVILHGGPGGGSSTQCRRYFDPNFYRIVMYDQRGAGKSLPNACLEDNTTWHLINDIEELRKHLNIEKWHTIFGASWGSTLSLAYAETHPSRVRHLVLCGIFLGRTNEIKFLYQEGSSWLFPELHEELKNNLPEVEQNDILFNYWRRLQGNNEQEKLKFAKSWTRWELGICQFFIDQEMLEDGIPDNFALAFARIETHYFVNGNFFKKNNQLLDDTHKIEHIPTEIIQGRYDVVCPAKSAYELHKKLNNSTLHIIPDAGHSAFEEGNVDAIIRATDKFKNYDT